MRTPKAVIGLARQKGAKTVEIKFVDAIGSSRQFTCRVEEVPGGLGEGFDDTGVALTNSLRAVTSGLGSRLKNPRFTCRGFGLENGPVPAHSGSVTGLTPDQRARDSGQGSNAAGVPCEVAQLRSNSIILIEQDAVFRKFIRLQLEERGFHVRDVATAAEGLEAVRHSSPGAVLVDMDIPDADGVTLIRQLRGWSQVPIMALAGQVSGIGAVDAFDAGASYFISRPVNPSELSARLRAVQRRNAPPSPEIFRSGSLTVDLTRRLVSVAGKAVPLSVTEYSLLHVLIRNAGMVVSYAQMLREVWGAEMSHKVNYLRVYFVALRKKLELPFEPDLLLTERSIGYRLVVR